jgi:hypothetical protein
MEGRKHVYTYALLKVKSPRATALLSIKPPWKAGKARAIAYNHRRLGRTSHDNTILSS